MLGMLIQSRYDELQLKSMPAVALCSLAIPLLCCTTIGIFRCAQQYFKFDISQILPPYGHWLTTMMTPLYYVIIFALCLYITQSILSNRTVELKSLDLLENIGKYSFGIYLVHALILYVIILAFQQFGFDWNNWLFYPLVCILTLVLSYLCVEIIRKFPYNEYIIGSTG